MRVVRDRRSSLRVAVDGEAVVYTTRDVIEGRCVDLGRDGVAIRSTRAARNKEPATLDLRLEGQRVRLEAVLARRQRIHGDYLMGFAFVQLDPEARACIDRVIAERLAGSPEGEQLLALAALAAARPAAPMQRESAERTAERTVVAAAGLIVPVISGHTQVVAMDRLPTAPQGDRTVVAPPPSRTDPVRMPSEPVRSPPPTFAPVSFDDSWFEDEMDTAEYDLPEATDEPDAEAQPERTVVTAPEHTVAAAPERTLVTASERTVVAAPERTVVIAPEHAVVDAPERTLLTAGAPELVARTPTATVLFELQGHPVAEPSVPERTVTLEPPQPPPPLRGARSPRASLDADATIPGTSPLARPTQRALQEAMALLRPPNADAPRKGPRVIVAIPHRTYRRGRGSPWNR